MNPQHNARAHAPLLPGTTVVALHSSGAGARQWASWRSLWPAGAEIVTPDLIGYADDGSLVASVTLDEEARRVAHVVDAVPHGVHLVGHSYGGAVALRVALARPHRVRGLWLYEPVLFALLRGDDTAHWRDIVAAGRVIGALARNGQVEASASHFVDYWSGRGAWASLAPPRRRAIAERMAKVAAEFDALFDDDLPTTAYRALHVPVRVLCNCQHGTKRSDCRARGISNGHCGCSR